MRDNNSKAIIQLICNEYRIEIFEFYSNSKYGDLPEARKLYCLVMSKLGFKNIEIARSLNFSPVRVYKLIEFGQVAYINIPYFKSRCDTIVDKYINI